MLMYLKTAGAFARSVYDSCKFKQGLLSYHSEDVLIFQ